MAYYYVDPDTGSNSNSGDSWAQAYANLDDLADSSTLGGGAAFVDAGDTVFYRSQSAGKDTKAAQRILDFNGGSEDKTQPLKIIGVKAATTNEGASVVASDIAVKGETQPIFAVTGAGNDLNITTSTASMVFVGVRFEIVDQMIANSGNTLTFVDNTFNLGNRFRMNGGWTYFHNCDIDFVAASDFFQPLANHFEWHGGAITGAAATTFLNTNPLNNGPGYFYDVDLSGLSSTANIMVPGNNVNMAHFNNCKLPSGAYSLLGGAKSEETGGVELISSSGSGSHTTSVQDYEYEDFYGTVDLSTNYRDGGADDGSTGEFSYAMVTAADKTLEGTHAALKSPWFRVWVPGDGATAKTLTVYTTHDNGTSGGIDLYEDELWVEFSTTAEDGDSDNTYTVIDVAERFLVNTTAAGADDTGSTWNNAAGSPTNNTYKQKFAVTYTPDYDGFASARVWYAKRMTGSFDTLYVDPRIIVT